MLYVGSRLPADPTVEWGGAVQAACLIDPGLPLATALSLGLAETDRCVPFAGMTPQARLAFLKWSAGGRRDGSVPVAFAFLHCSALERRLLLDRPETKESAELVEEIRRISALFASHGSFARACSLLVSTVSARTVIESREALAAWRPDEHPENRGTALVTKVAVAVGAVRGEALGFALAWAGYRALRPRLPNARRHGALEAAPEFRTLLEARFAARYPRGFRIDPPRASPFRLSYQAIDPGLEVGLSVEGWPGTLPDPANGRWDGMATLVDRAAADLAAFHRMHEQGRGDSAAAAAALPADFPDSARRVGLSGFVEWLDALAGPLAAVPARDLAMKSVGTWPLTPSLRKESLRMLRDVGRGAEPDPEHGAIETDGETAWIFRIPREATGCGASDAFRMADAVSQMLGSVASSSGGRDASDAAAALVRLADALGLAPHEAVRLSARHAVTGDRKLTPARHRKLLSWASPEEKETAANLAATLSVAEARADTARVGALERLFDAVGVERRSLYRTLHRGPVAVPTTLATGPVLVEVPPAALGFRIPAPAAPPIGVPTEPPANPVDRSRVEAVIEETRRVSESLARIYEGAEDACRGPETLPEPIGAPPGAGHSPPGLDGGAASLLLALLARPAWSRRDYDALARAMGLLPDGAIETLNEWSYAEIGEEIVEDGEPLRVAAEILRGLPWARPALAKNTPPE
jgi:hypothetical protein